MMGIVSMAMFNPFRLEGVEMLSDWIARINNGEKLSPTEIGLFKERMDALENKVSYWSQKGDETLYARKMWAQEAFFQTAPMSFAVPGISCMGPTAPASLTHFLGLYSVL